jgi:multicomponent Na+:H+ antiporter subunit E
MLLLFFLAWVVFNGRLTLEIALFGVVVSCAVYAFICKFMDYSPQKELRFYKKIPLFFQYIWCLLREIVSANIAVCRMILTRRERIEPVIVHVHTDLKTQTGRMLLANSITLTPGTITVSMTDTELLVHCLDKSLSEGIEDSAFVHLLHKLEEV